MVWLLLTFLLLLLLLPMPMLMLMLMLMLPMLMLMLMSLTFPMLLLPQVTRPMVLRPLVRRPQHPTMKRFGMLLCPAMKRFGMLLCPAMPVSRSPTEILARLRSRLLCRVAEALLVSRVRNAMHGPYFARSIPRAVSA